MTDFTSSSGKILRIKPGNFEPGTVAFRAALRALVLLRAGEGRALEVAEFGELDPVQAATVEGVSNPLVRRYLLKFLAISRERTVVYGLPPDNITAEEIRHRRAVAAELDKLTNGKSWELERADRDEWRRLSAVAEANVREKTNSKSHGT